MNEFCSWNLKSQSLQHVSRLVKGGVIGSSDCAAPLGLRRAATEALRQVEQITRADHGR